jgi:hypothetical protein
MRLLLLAACLATAACGQGATPKAEAPPAVVPKLELQGPYAACGAVSAAGWCGLAFGEASEGAETRARVPLIPQIDEATLHDPGACRVFTTSDGPTSIAFLSVEKKLGSVSIAIPGPVTAEGIGVDSKEADLKAKYPAAKAGPNKYEPAVTDYEVDQPPGKLVFQVEAGSVRRFKAGIAPSIDYVEGCG